MRHVVVALLLVSALSGAAIAQEAPAVDEATTTFDVELQPDGSAEWTVETTVPLDSAEERDGFRTYGEQFVAGETTVGPGIAFFERAAASASTASGRQMTIEAVSRDYSVGDDAGVLRLEFRWTAFLESDGEGYRFADALSTPDGTWLSSLEAGQELRIYTPAGYDIQRSSIEARQENESLVVSGPESFDPEQFEVIYHPEGAAGSQTGSSTPGGGGVDGLVAVLIGLLVLAVGVLAVWRWRGGESIDGVVAEPRGGGDDDDGAAAVEEPDSSDPPEVDPELLSDEERVEALLERNGGRMRQAAIVEETDWSDAKVSQLLSRMADEGEIEKLRLGRENVISLPDEDEER